MILAIDTTGPKGSVALDEDVLEIHAPDGYGGVLFAVITELLIRHSVQLHQIDCFAAAAGPGTFTGVRVGLTCAKGLAEALGKPVCVVSNLEALAEFGVSAMRAVVIDARRGDIYAAVYGSQGRIIVPERVLTPDEFQASLPEGDIEWVKNDGPLAGAIAHVAGRQRWTDPAEAYANYLRRTDAELNLR